MNGSKIVFKDTLDNGMVVQINYHKSLIHNYHTAYIAIPDSLYQYVTDKFPEVTGGLTYGDDYDTSIIPLSGDDWFNERMHVIGWDYNHSFYEETPYEVVKKELCDAVEFLTAQITKNSKRNRVRVKKDVHEIFERFKAGERISTEDIMALMESGYL